MIGYLLRRLVTACSSDSPCLAYRCGRRQIATPTRWCRRHTDAILYQRGDEGHEYPWRQEVAARLAGLDVDRLGAEIDAGRAVALARYLGAS